MVPVRSDLAVVQQHQTTLVEDGRKTSAVLFLQQDNGPRTGDSVDESVPLDLPVQIAGVPNKNEHAVGRMRLAVRWGGRGVRELCGKTKTSSRLPKDRTKVAFAVPYAAE